MNQLPATAEPGAAPTTTPGHPRWTGVTGSYPQWYEDPLSCLQTTLGSILLEHGLSPVEVLGLACEFAFAPGDAMCEEFYRPAQSERGVAADLCPYHDVTSAWTSGSSAEDLVGLIDEHAGVIVAVDNYYLPFRPAYQDVHAAHLVVVPAWRRTATGETEFYVSDVQPPRFQGWLPARHLVDSWTSGNPSDTQDVFFSSREIGGRVLTVTVGSAPEKLTGRHLRQALTGNLDRWDHGTAADDDRVWTGRAGLVRFVDWLTERGADPHALRPAYTFGWAMQAQAHLHGRLAQEAGRLLPRPHLARVAASADRLVGAWTNVRLLSAHAAHLPDLPELTLRRGAELRHAYEQLAVDWRLALTREWTND